MNNAAEFPDAAEAAVAKEMALLIANDAFKYPTPGAKLQGTSRPLQIFDDSSLSAAKAEIAKEMDALDLSPLQASFDASWTELHSSSTSLSSLAAYSSSSDEAAIHQAETEAFDAVQTSLQTSADRSNKLEKKLNLHFGGYQQRAKTLRAKIGEAAEALGKERVALDTFRTLQVGEEAALPRRLEALREEVEVVRGRERELQEAYRGRVGEVEGLRGR